MTHLKTTFHRLRWFALALAATWLTGQWCAAVTVTWDGGAGDGQWTSPNNWSSNTLPTANDIAWNATGATVNLNGAGFAGRVYVSNNGKLTIQPGAALTLSDAEATTIRIGINGTAGTLNVLGGSINASSGSIQLASGSPGTINQRGGSVSVSGITFGSGAGGYDLSGGSLTLGGTLNLRGAGASFRQSGGEVTVASGLQLGGGSNSAYVLSGGELTVNGPSNGNLFFWGNNGTFRVEGGGTANLKHVRYFDAGSRATARFEFEFQHTAEQIGKMNFTGHTIERDGTLEATLAGGVMLTGRTSFDLMEAPAFSGNFDAQPDGLWTTSLANNVNGTRDAVRIAFNGPAAATLDYDIGGAITFDSPGLQYGYVDLTGAPNPSTLGIYFDLLSGNQSLLEAAFDEAGLTYATGQRGYDMMLLYHPVAGSSHFAWDFRHIDPNLRIGAIQALLIPEPASWVLLTGGGLLFGALARFRRRKRNAAL